MSLIVKAARKYLGVKWRHRGRNSLGLDCAGLPWVAYKDCGVKLQDYRLYGPEPHSDGLTEHMTIALGPPLKTSPISQRDLHPGDIIVIRFVTEPHHVGIVTDYPYNGALGVIHSDGHYGKVIEHRLSQDYIDRITHLYRRPV